MIQSYRGFIQSINKTYTTLVATLLLCTYTAKLLSSIVQKYDLACLRLGVRVCMR